MKDFNKIKRGFEAYYTLVNQGNELHAQATELLKKLEEEFNGVNTTITKVTGKNGSKPSELRINILNMLKSNVSHSWSVKELSDSLKADPAKVGKALANAFSSKQVMRKGVGLYSYKAS